MAILMKNTSKISNSTHLFNVEDTATKEDLLALMSISLENYDKLHNR